MGPRRRAVALTAGALVVLIGLSAPRLGGPSLGEQPPEPPSDAPLVYLSGLDEHMQPAYATVPVYDRPEGQAVASAPAGSLAWVHTEASGWLEVSLAEGEPVHGWVGDYFLRGELHLVDPRTPACPVPGDGVVFAPSTKVRLLDLRPTAAGSQVLVRSLATAELGWVAREVLSEQPGPHPARIGAGPCEEYSPVPTPTHAHPTVSR
jgi:hypothetical protein